MPRSRVSSGPLVILAIALFLPAAGSSAAAATADSTRFAWPLAWPFTHPRLRIAEYVDDDPSPISSADYMDADLTYEGHRGTDFDVNSFRDMDEGVPVLAVANGWVLGADDSQFDRQISLPPVPWNFVSILHENGSISIYGHLRKHSVTVIPGEYVREGQIIGLLGSSGSVWMPHLHFEVLQWSITPDGNPHFDGVRDPWSGPKNPVPSLWKHQEEYVGDDHFRLLDLGVTTLPAILDEGGVTGDQSAFKERPSQPAVFGINERFLKVWTLVYGQIGDPYRVEIHRPDGALFTGIDGIVQPNARNAGRGWQFWDVPFSGYVSPADFGVWSAQVISGGETAAIDSFTVGATSTFGPRFHWLAGKSFHLFLGSQYDTLLVSTRLGAPYADLTFSLENAPNNVSISGADALGRKLVVIGPPGPDLAGIRSRAFDVVVTDPSGLQDRKYYQLINYKASTLGSPPSVVAPPSRSAFEGETLTVDVSAIDPDGDTIAELTANLSGLPPGSQATFLPAPDHTTGKLIWPTKIGQSGIYAVTFTATTSLGGSAVLASLGYQPIIQTGSATTTITIEKVPAARAFVMGADKIIRLASDKPTWCVYVEPMNASFALEEIDPSAVELVSEGTGSVDRIAAQVGKTTAVGDKDRNSVSDAPFCFTKEDLRRIFEKITGRQQVLANIEGRLMSGGRFMAQIQLDVIVEEEDEQSARVVPNPLNPEGALTLHLSKRGPLRVQLFDLQGRLVRTFVDRVDSPAGKIEVRVDAHDAGGERLASGVYLFRVTSAAGVTTGTFVVLK